MPSPFPGMNPYLEQDDVWHDFHEAFLPQLREQIAMRLAPHYIVKIDEHVYIHEPPAEERTFLGRADVFVATRSTERPRPGPAVSDAPEQISLPTVDVE